MIDCRALCDQLLQFRDGELSAGKTELVREHLHLCPPCMDLFRSYEELLEVMERLKPVNMPEGFMDRLRRCAQDAAVDGGEAPDESADPS